MVARRLKSRLIRFTMSLDVVFDSRNFITAPHGFILTVADILGICSDTIKQVFLEIWVHL